MLSEDDAFREPRRTEQTELSDSGTRCQPPARTEGVLDAHNLFSFSVPVVELLADEAVTSFLAVLEVKLPTDAPRKATRPIGAGLPQSPTFGAKGALKNHFPCSQLPVIHQLQLEFGRNNCFLELF
ncbi:hypothetical protein CEXT_19181 [Caerostris extrusa]|uniref:Uncharacterized protein n=1 Tax=Caerostris extrusa TaxID=172846 RepID=A0AAV4X8V7_CAEEX|nr:hypothetical protein CEXT_19181 [Caerostris extrusa]